MFNYKLLLNLISTGLLLLTTTSTIAQPTTNPATRENNRLNRVLFKPPPEEEKPKHTRGAGSRNDGQCSQDVTPANLGNPSSREMAMIPLVPSSNFGLTIAQRPSFWIYLPETSAKQLVLVIREEGKTYHSQTFMPITGQSGLMELKVSEDSPPLEVGKNYQWAVVLVCGSRPSPNDPAIASWIRPISLSEQNNQGASLEQAAWYAEQGLWYDALTTLMQVKRSQPNSQNLTQIWTEFLNSAGLDSHLAAVQ